MSRKPHIIILNPDEMRWDTMGHMGNRAAWTPNLDALASEEAVSFDHAYCQNPVCVPSRCSFFTGLYPHTTGHRTMQYLMHENEPSLFSELKNAGYYVWLNGRNDFLAGQVNGIEAMHADEVFYYDKDQPAGIPAAAAGKKSGPMKPADPDTREYSHFQGIAENAGEKDWRDTNAAIERIRHLDEIGDQPLCLFLGWNNPHPTYVTRQKYYDQIRADEIPVPVVPADTSDKSLMIRKLEEYEHLNGWTPEQFKEMRHVYLAQCAMVDDMVGHVIDALKEAGIYDDCAIFFFSDHGDFAGDFNLAEKAQSTLEDVLTRVPFLVKPPKMKDENGNDRFPVDPGVAESPVELVDFYATAMKFAGVEPCHDHFGRDLQPEIADRTAAVRNYAHSEGGRNECEWQCDEWHAAGPNGPDPNNDYYAKMRAQKEYPAHEKAAMVTDGTWKLIYRSSDACEIYNLKEDPQEKHNLYAQAEQDPELMKVSLRLQKELLNWYQTTCDTVPKQLDSRFTEEGCWAMARNLVPADKEQQVREFFRTNHPTPRGMMMYAVKLRQEAAEKN